MKKRETIGKRMFVTLATAFVMILMMGVPTLAAGSLDVELVPNGKGAYVYTGRMPDYNTVVYHKLTVNKSGALVVAGASFSDYGNQWGLSVGVKRGAVQQQKTAHRVQQLLCER